MNKNQSFSPTIKQLRAFVGVYQLHKLSAAASRLFVTPSAISVLIRQLEEGLEVRLFDRTTRVLKPTPAAHETVKIAERILRDLGAFGAELQDLTNLRRGRVTVVATPMLAEILLPRAVQLFNEQHPEIQFAIDDCAPNQFYAQVMGEHADFGIGTPEGAIPGLEFLTLMRDHLSVVCAPTHPLAKHRVLRWKDLDGLPVMTVRPGYGIRSLIELSASRAGVRLNVVQEVSFPATALWMAAQGGTPAILPAALVGFSRNPNLVSRTLTSPKVSRNILLAFKRGRSLSPAASQFIAVLRNSLGTSGAPD